MSPEPTVTELLARIESLEAALAARGMEPTIVQRPAGPLTRRRLLGAAAAGAAGLAAGLAGKPLSVAAVTSPVNLNVANPSTAQTSIAASGDIAGAVFEADASGAGSGFLTVGLSGFGGPGGVGTQGGTGVLGQGGHITGGLGSVGVIGYGTSPTGAIAFGVPSALGVGVAGFGGSGVGLQGGADSGIGGSFSGGTAAIHLAPAANAGMPVGGTHTMGDVICDSVGALWVFTNAGWKQLLTSVPPPPNVTGVTTFLATPVRAIDTRSTGPMRGGITGPLNAGGTYSWQIGGLNGIPANALGIIGNLTAVNFPGAGFLSIFPGGTAWPGTSSLNFFGGIGSLANAFSVGLGGSPKQVSIFVSGNVQCDAIVDVAGYLT